MLTTPQIHDRQAQLAALQGRLPGIVIRLNQNRQTLISLRRRPNGNLCLSLHADLLDDDACLAALPGWVASPNSPAGAVIRTSMDAVFRRQQAARPRPAAPALPTLHGRVDLAVILDRLASAWFPDLSRPAIEWGPDRRVLGPRRRIRFGAYHRAHGGRIVINRLIAQPWVAVAFLEFVVYHELCHHAQACHPVRGESPHSPRFQAWESRFPNRERVLAWERAHLDRFLGLSGGAVDGPGEGGIARSGMPVP